MDLLVGVAGRNRWDEKALTVQVGISNCTVNSSWDDGIYPKSAMLSATLGPQRM